MKKRSFRSHTSEGALVQAGLTPDEANAVETRARVLRTLDTIDFTAEFQMFFVFWAKQGRTVLLETILDGWEKLWKEWHEEAKLLNISPLRPCDQHTQMIEKLYTRYEVVFDPHGLPRPKVSSRPNLPTTKVA